MGIGKTLVILGIICIAAGLFFMAGGKLSFLGHLPGDIHTDVYFPWVSCLVVSIVGTVLLNLFFRR